MIRVVVADDQAMIRTALATLVGLAPDVEVVGQAGTGEEAVALVGELRPDVVLMDVQMPCAQGPRDGIEATREIVRRVPGTRVVVVTTFGRAGWLRRAMEAGASGFMVKDAPAEDLVEAIRRVHAGLRVVDPELAAQSLTLGPSPLTEGETRVLAAAKQGGTTAEIAARCHLSEGTVRNYLSSAIGKLGAANRAEAARLAVDNGWL